MNALQEPPNPPRLTSKKQPRNSSYHRSRSDRPVAIEITAKLVVNSILSVVAIAALVELLPYQLTQQEKLQELRLEVQATETRIGDLKKDFARYSDPVQAQKVMQAQNPRLEPDSRRIVLISDEQ
jgi:hypothetical protein